MKLQIYQIWQDQKAFNYMKTNKMKHIFKIVLLAFRAFAVLKYLTTSLLI